MSDADILVGAFKNSLSPEDVDLTDREKALLIKLLSNPAYFPDLFKSWLANVIPMIAADIPISNIAGFIKPSRITDYPTDPTKFLRGDGEWVKIAGSPVETWGDADATWGDADETWAGEDI